MTSISRNNEFINLVHATTTQFALGDPVVHYVCGFKAPSRMFYQAKLLISVFQHIWELLHALSIQKRTIQCWFVLNIYKNKDSMAAILDFPMVTELQMCPVYLFTSTIVHLDTKTMFLLYLEAEM